MSDKLTPEKKLNFSINNKLHNDDIVKLGKAISIPERLAVLELLPVSYTHLSSSVVPTGSSLVTPVSMPSGSPFNPSGSDAKAMTAATERLTAMTAERHAKSDFFVLLIIFPPVMISLSIRRSSGFR